MTDPILYDRHPDTYLHWSLTVSGPVATLTLDIDEEGGLLPGYKLKLNSYDLGVDIELHDALQRIRFEHPSVKSVIITSGLSRMFCAGANIYMLGKSDHGWKVNFCKFTNETRNGIEDTSRHSGTKFIAALNGTTAGGGYELALACDEIWLVDDRSSAVSLPEVPLLGVLPGTGGLTRVVDKRKVRRDLADVFCTSEEGVRGKRAKEWGCVDELAPAQDFMVQVEARAADLAGYDSGAEGIPLTALNRNIDESGYHYTWVSTSVDQDSRTATVTIRAPVDAAPDTVTLLDFPTSRKLLVDESVWHVSKPPALKGHALQAPILVMQLAKFQNLEKGTAADAAQAWWRTMFLGAGEDDSLKAPPAGFFKWK